MLGTLLMRKPLPARRRSWCQKVKIGGQTIYLSVGEYEDGKPGEIFVDMSKEGTTMRGVMGTLARTISIALQCGAEVDMIVHALRGLDYPPDGPVDGSDTVTECYSITDWIAQELEARYMSGESEEVEYGLDETESTGMSNSDYLPEGQTD